MTTTNWREREDDMMVKFRDKVLCILSSERARGN